MAIVITSAIHLVLPPLLLLTCLNVCCGTQSHSMIAATSTIALISSGSGDLSTEIGSGLEPALTPSISIATGLTAGPTSSLAGPTISPSESPSPSQDIPMPVTSSAGMGPQSSSTSQDITVGTTTSTSLGSPGSPQPSSDSTPTIEPTEDEEILGLIVGVAVGGTIFLILAVVALVLVAMFFKLKCKPKKPRNRNFSPSGDKLLRVSLEELNTGIGMATPKQPVDLKTLFAHIPADIESIPLEKFQEHVKSLHEDDQYDAKEEYKDVKDLDSPISKVAATLPCNEPKNRYINILPNDETRVVLESDPKVPGSDFINANFIAGYSREKEYIAAQGPLPGTISDFWRMIWEYNTHTIVMVTNPVEGGTVKCHKYWPEEGSLHYGRVVVTLENEKHLPEYIVRTLSISRTSGKKKITQVGVTREVIQYHFTAWPDFGVPREASSMLKFVRKIRLQLKEDHGPMVIHCSAGVGRTGTFIAIDVMLQRMAAGEALNIQEFVCQMRAQRNNMVQTDAQYLFIYDAVLHTHRYGNKDLSVAQLEEHIAALSRPVEGKDEGTLLGREFQCVMDMPAPPEDASSMARYECNKHKNRNMEDVALNCNRVVLYDATSPNANYINASFIRGYSQKREFIVTQHPLQATMSDFWKMVLERDIVTIVVIGPLSDSDAEERYWPGEGGGEYGGTSIELLSSEKLDSGIIVRELQLECAEMEACMTVHQYHLLAWPLDEEAPPSPEGMLALVRESRRHQEKAELEEGFIAVHSSCSLKIEAAGVYCAVSILLSQIEAEGSLDMSGTVSQLREQRPGIITSKDYYHFIYQVVAAAH